MNIKKTTALLLAVLMMTALFAGCGKTNEETKTTGTSSDTVSESVFDVSSETEAQPTRPADAVTVRLGGLKGPTSMGMVKLLEDDEKGITANDYEFTMATTADELSPKLLKGELDILAVPANLGSILYNKSSGKVKMCAVTKLGVLYIVEKGGETVKSLADLKGKTLYATGKGTTPEFALNYLLAQNGVDMASEVTVEWKSEPTEIVSLMAAQDSAIAMIPQPFATVAGTKVEGLRTALDLSAEWDKLDNGSKLITAGLIVRSEFAEEHPEALKKFIEEYSASVNYVNSNVKEAAALIEKLDIVKAAIAEKAIPYCNLVCIVGAEMKTAAEGYLKTLFDQKADSVGGMLPDSDFFLIYE